MFVCVRERGGEGDGEREVGGEGERGREGGGEREGGEREGRKTLLLSILTSVFVIPCV